MPADAQKSLRRAYFGWISCGAPFIGGLLGVIAARGTDWRINLLIGVAIGSGPGMLCAAIAIWRRERWYAWALGLLFNTYPFLLFLIGASVLLGIMKVHF